MVAELVRALVYQLKGRGFESGLCCLFSRFISCLYKWEKVWTRCACAQPRLSEKNDRSRRPRQFYAACYICTHAASKSVYTCAGLQKISHSEWLTCMNVMHGCVGQASQYRQDDMKWFVVKMVCPESWRIAPLL